MSEEGGLSIDPWGTTLITKYERLFSVFGIRPFKEVLKYFDRPHHLMRRGVVFGHRDFDRVLEAHKRGEKVILLTGLMPSGRFHFGHKMVFDQIIFYQKLGFDVAVAIADIEAYAVRRLPRREIIRLALDEYVSNAIALGLEKKGLRIYFQSNMDAPYYRLMQLASQKATMAEMQAIYGELSPGKILSVFTQVADILHPMLKEYGGYSYVFVPVGADQDPHIRFTRDIADRFEKELGMRRPASTYHRLMRGLDGKKMSSSRPETAIFLTDEPSVAASKLKRALTGGRVSVEEQRRLGGEPEKCSVYEMYVYHLLLDDSKLQEIYRRCRGGQLLCGECKAMAAEMLEKWLIEHQRKLEKAKDMAEKYVEVPSF
jgi:tryptophanyl-tRNA synthetase